MIKILKYGEVEPSQIFARAMPEVNVTDTVAEIIREVREKGDKALFAYCEKFDHVQLSALAVSEAEIEEAMKTVEPRLIRVLTRASENIRKFHECQKRTGFILNQETGVVMGQKIIPIDRAGLYVPGGTASYPSTVLMDAIPAKIAGCRDVVMVTPPGQNGKVNPAILAAAKIAGVDRIFKVGGAQAIAALAYGTESIPKVDKIVGPGNAFVAEAKKQVFGAVSIDMIAGPSEILILADKSADPALLAADMLSQAEHDALASAICITDSAALAENVVRELEKQYSTLPRAATAFKSLTEWGAVVVVPDMACAVALANRVAPEHLELCTEDPWSVLPHIRHAGAVFMGRYSPEPVGDYYAGPNHVLPTMGTARFSSALSVQTFCKKTSIVAASETFVKRHAASIARLARLEGLEAHARSVESRISGHTPQRSK